MNDKEKMAKMERARHEEKEKRQGHTRALPSLSNVHPLP